MNISFTFDTRSMKGVLTMKLLNSRPLLKCTPSEVVENVFNGRGLTVVGNGIYPAGNYQTTGGM